MGRRVSSTRDTRDTSNRHECHAAGCKTPIAAKFLMCGRHWAMVPPKLQQAVYREYRPGQEVDKRPTHDYLVVMWRAVIAVAQKEGKSLDIFKEERERQIAHFGVEPPALTQVIREVEQKNGIINSGFSVGDEARAEFAKSASNHEFQPRLELYSEEADEVVPLVQINLFQKEQQEDVD